MKNSNVVDTMMRHGFNALNKESYVAPRVVLKEVAVEDGFGASKFYGLSTEVMNVVSWD